MMKVRRSAVALVMVAGTTIGLQAADVRSASADCPVGQSVCTPTTNPNGGSVHVQFSGTGINAVDGTGTSVPPDCWFQDGMPLQEAFNQRVALALIEWLIPLLRLPLHPLSDYAQALEDHPKDSPEYSEWKWYWLKCRPGFNLASDEALAVGDVQDWYGLQVSSLDKLLHSSEPPPGGVSVNTLLLAAQDAFTIPEPVITQSPSSDEGGATLVNLPTWFWADNALESYTITATAGPVSVTLSAVNTGYTLTSSAGSAECTHEQFTTKWTEELNDNPDAGCTIAFDEPGDHEVTVSSTWDVTWTGTGINGTNTLDPLTPSSTITVPVVEQWGDVTDVG